MVAWASIRKINHCMHTGEEVAHSSSQPSPQSSYPLREAVTVRLRWSSPTWLAEKEQAPQVTDWKYACACQHKTDSHFFSSQSIGSESQNCTPTWFASYQATLMQASITWALGIHPNIASLFDRLSLTYSSLAYFFAWGVESKLSIIWYSRWETEWTTSLRASAQSSESVLLLCTYTSLYLPVCGWQW